MYLETPYRTLAGNTQYVIEGMENPGSFIVLTDDRVLRLTHGDTK